MWAVAGAFAQTAEEPRGRFVEGIPRVDVQHFRPSVDADGFLWVDDAHHRAPGVLSTRVLVGYADDLLLHPAPRRSEDGDLRIVGALWSMDALFGVQIGRVRAGARIPVVLLARSDLLPDEGGLGDLQLDSRMTLLDGDATPVDLAATFRVTLPTDVLDNALGSDRGGLEVAVAGSRKFGPGYAAANLGLSEVQTVDIDGGVVGPTMPVRLGVGRVIGDAGVAAELAGWVPLVRDGWWPCEAMISGQYTVDPDTDVHLGVGTGLGHAPGSPALRLELGVSYRSRFDGR